MVPKRTVSNHLKPQQRFRVKICQDAEIKIHVSSLANQNSKSSFSLTNILCADNLKDYCLVIVNNV